MLGIAKAVRGMADPRLKQLQQLLMKAEKSASTLGGKMLGAGGAAAGLGAGGVGGAGLAALMGDDEDALSEEEMEKAIAMLRGRM